MAQDLGASLASAQALAEIYGLGRAGVNQIYPDEIEYFACAIELVDSTGELVNFFSFPIMPSNLQMNTTTNTSIVKTMGGVVVNTNPTFTPFPITLNGDFGRKFRLINPKTNQSNLFDVTSNTDQLLPSDSAAISSIGNKLEFSTDYKTGYGNVRILYSILEKSKTLDQYNGTYRLIFYNISFNQSYFVEYMPGQFFVNKEKNGIWQYNLNLQVVAPASAIITSEDLASNIQSLVNFSRLTNSINVASSSISSVLNLNGIGISPNEVVVALNNQANSNLSNKSQSNPVNVVENLLDVPLSAASFVVNPFSNILSLI